MLKNLRKNQNWPLRSIDLPVLLLTNVDKAPAFKGALEPGLSKEKNNWKTQGINYLHHKLHAILFSPPSKISTDQKKAGRKLLLKTHKDTKCCLHIFSCPQLKLVSLCQSEKKASPRSGSWEEAAAVCFAWF